MPATPFIPFTPLRLRPRRQVRHDPSNPAAGVVLGSIGLSLLVGLVGCAGTGRSPGDRLLRNEDCKAAVIAYREEEASRPDDPRLIRNLGAALLCAGEDSEAVVVLERARRLAPGDSRAAYDLARARERTGDLDGAIRNYGDYLGLGGHGRFEVQARLRDLSRRKARLEIEAALAREDSLSAERVAENSLAVPDFTNPAEDDTLAPLARGLAVMLITDLSKVRALHLLERARIRVLLDEISLTHPAADESEPEWAPLTSVPGIKQRLAFLRRESGEPYWRGSADDSRDEAYSGAVREFQSDHGLQADGIVGAKTRAALEEAVEDANRARATTAQGLRQAEEGAFAPRLGRILGAQRLVQGSFVPLADTDIQLDASLIEVWGGQLSPAGDPVSGRRDDILVLEKKLTYQVLDALGVAPTPEERREIDKLPTRNLLAFLAFSRGLMEEDEGLYEAAAASYSEAYRRDRSFSAARNRREIVRVTAADQRSLDRSELHGGTSAVVDPGNRLLRNSVSTGVDPGLEFDLGDVGDPSQTGTTIAGRSVLIEIDGELPQERGR